MAVSLVYMVSERVLWTDNDGQTTEQRGNAERGQAVEGESSEEKPPAAAGCGGLREETAGG